MERLLINYLPYVVRDYDVFKGLTDGEQPEFELAWNGYELDFADQFIDTASDYGLSRWESMLNLNPRGTDTLESRRIKIKAKLNTIIPYTFRALLQKITAIAEGSPFSLNIDVGTYLLQIVTQWEINGQVDSLKGILDQMLPANIAVDSQNNIPCEPAGIMYVGSGLSFCEWIAISDAGKDYFQLETDMTVPAVSALCNVIPLDDAGNENIQVEQPLFMPEISGLADVISLTDAGDESVDLQESAVFPAGTVITETINLFD